MIFEPTEKQLAALARMESYISVNNHRTHFESHDEFQDYWNLVSKRCDKVSRHKQTHNPAIAPIASGEQIKQRADSQLAYYNIEKNLRSYAEKYCQRYQPSCAKLQSQLVKKSHNEALSTQIADALGVYIDDNAQALQLAERMREQGKNKKYIAGKLIQRQFTQTSIDHSIQSIASESGSLWDTDVLLKKVEKLKDKGFSLHAIRQRLCEQAADTPLIEDALRSVFGDLNDDKNLKQAIHILRGKHLEDEAIIKRLVTKGFRYGAIKESLSKKS